MQISKYQSLDSHDIIFLPLSKLILDRCHNFISIRPYLPFFRILFIISIIIHTRLLFFKIFINIIFYTN